MRDFATSDHPGVARQLARLGALSLPQGRLGLQVIHALLAALGNPQDRLPPVFHVAGTNGKGSTCAYLRAMMEAQGLVVHSATKPHLVRYNERIRVAGHLIEDEALATLLAEVLDAAESLPEGMGASFFEVTTAALLLAFSRNPADACVIEVGLGGRLDATNVFKAPAVTGIATLGIDHEAFLLSPEAGTPPVPIARIAFEKAGIARPGTPLVTQPYPHEAATEVRRIAQTVGARLAMRGEAWDAAIGDVIGYRDAWGDMTLPLPTLVGQHQADNAALAVAMLRHQNAVHVSPQAMARGIRDARWPARLQRLGAGPLTELAGARALWLDGGHNPDAGVAIARHFAGQPPVHLIIGMLANKDPAALLRPLAPSLRSVRVVPAPGHDAHRPEDFAGHTALPVRAFADVSQAIADLPPEGDVLIAGSLYLAGEVLRLNREFPD
jgi:dihydrofolate synthase / folylpolyglutamate synthase